MPKLRQPPDWQRICWYLSSHVLKLLFSCEYVECNSTTIRHWRTGDSRRGCIQYFVINTISRQCHTNGYGPDSEPWGTLPCQWPLAEQVPDALKPFSSQPLGRLAVSVGWRRGGSASLMADFIGRTSCCSVVVMPHQFILSGYLCHDST